MGKLILYQWSVRERPRRFLFTNRSINTNLRKSHTNRAWMESMTIADRQWRDSSVQQAFEAQSIALAHEHRHAPENDPSMVIARRLLCATALAGVVLFALPIIIKAPPDLPSPSTPVTVTGSVPLKAKPPDIRLPKPQ